MLKLIHTRPHPSAFIGGEQKFYREEGGNRGFSCINGEGAHAFPYYEEFMVEGSWEIEGWGCIDNDDIFVTCSKEESEDFLKKAEQLLL